MSEWKRFFCQLAGILYIPPELLQIEEKKLLHISDTPVGFYPDLRKLVEILKPDYIVHTGDMVDNIKLQLYPTSLFEHEKGIRKLASMLEASGAEIVLALGNHDDFDIAKKYFKRSYIIRVAETVLIESLSFRISHFPEGIRELPSRYNLFGHDLTLKSGCVDDRLYFNGISYINIIGLESGTFTVLSYPSGTDDARLGRRKIGI
jgi:predicted MPP superfamily phosphohydrolase